MASSSGSNTPIENAPPGLDRATFNVYEQAERHIAATLQASGWVEEADSIDSHGLASRPKKLRAKVKTKANELFHPTRKNLTPPGSPAAPCLAPPPPDIMDDDRLYNDVPEHKGPQAKDLIHNPISTVQSALHGASGAKVAQVMDNQVIAHGANVGLVRAWDKLGSAQNEEETNNAIIEIENLKKERQDSYVRWTIDRHVLKIRQDPPRILERPRRDDYKKVDKEGRVEMQWADYGRQVRMLFTNHAIRPPLFFRFRYLPVALYIDA